MRAHSASGQPGGVFTVRAKVSDGGLSTPRSRSLRTSWKHLRRFLRLWPMRTIAVAQPGCYEAGGLARGGTAVACRWKPLLPPVHYQRCRFFDIEGARYSEDGKEFGLQYSSASSTRRHRCPRPTPLHGRLTPTKLPSSADWVPDLLAHGPAIRRASFPSSPSPATAGTTGTHHRSDTRRHCGRKTFHRCRTSGCPRSWAQERPPGGQRPDAQFAKRSTRSMVIKSPSMT